MAVDGRGGSVLFSVGFGLVGNTENIEEKTTNNSRSSSPSFFIRCIHAHATKWGSAVEDQQRPEAANVEEVFRLACFGLVWEEKDAMMIVVVSARTRLNKRRPQSTINPKKGWLTDICFVSDCLRCLDSVVSQTKERGQLFCAIC
jgi:hypothetical protein